MRTTAIFYKNGLIDEEAVSFFKIAEMYKVSNKEDRFLNSKEYVFNANHTNLKSKTFFMNSALLFLQ